MQRFLLRIIRGPLALGFCWLLLAATVQAQQPVVLVLGDSISAAYGMSLEQGWVARMAQRLQHSHPHYQVVNASISGETTAGALRRLPQLLAEHDTAVVIVELGGNDGLRGYPVADLRKNLTSITELSQAAGARVLLLAMEIPPNYGSRYTSAFRESFAAVADATDAEVGPFILEQVATDPALMQADGIHPTAQAQERLLATVLPAVEALL